MQDGGEVIYHLNLEEHMNLNLAALDLVDGHVRASRVGLGKRIEIRKISCFRSKRILCETLAMKHVAHPGREIRPGRQPS